MKQPAVFLDRDDTLIVNIPYLGDPSKVTVFPESAEAMYRLRQANFLLFMVSNQSGVGRGLITRDQVHAVNAEMVRQLDGDHITAYYHSYATPDDPYATDRKPSPELLFQAAATHNLDLGASFFVGDRLSDLECGLNAGCRVVLLEHVKSSRAESDDGENEKARQKAHYVATTLHDAADWILSVSSKTPNLKTHELE